MKIEVTSQVYILGRHVPVGEVLEVPPHLGIQAVNCGRAKIATAGASTQPPPESEAPIAVEVRESALPPRRRR